jgi:GNAT superfamily N-acetyltransferase
MSPAEMRVVAAEEAGWSAVEAVMTSDASSRNCWCQFHVLENPVARQTTRQSRRALLAEQVETLDPPRGLVALAGDEPVGWCGVEPRTRLGHVLASRLVSKNSLFPADDSDVWIVYCILIPPARRLEGIGSRLLAAALDHARDYGARVVEGLPIDTSLREGRLAPGFSTGTLAMFEREGFTRVAALPSGRTLVYREMRE